MDTQDAEAESAISIAAAESEKANEVVNAIRRREPTKIASLFNRIFARPESTQSQQAATAEKK